MAPTPPVTASANPPRKRAVPRVALSLSTKGGANQADAQGANINTIVAQYKKNGTMPAVQNSNPLFGDFTFPEDIHSMREAVFAAMDRFQQLPADVRSICDNDWVRFQQIFHDPNPTQLQSLEAAGLIIVQTQNNNTPPSSPVPLTSTGTAPPASPGTPQPVTTANPTPGSMPDPNTP